MRVERPLIDDLATRDVNRPNLRFILIANRPVSRFTGFQEKPFALRLRETFWAAIASAWWFVPAVRGTNTGREPRAARVRSAFAGFVANLISHVRRDAAQLTGAEEAAEREVTETAPTIRSAPERRVLESGVSGHGLLRFVYLDPPGLIRSWKITGFCLVCSSRGLHRGAFDDDTCGNIFPERDQQLSRQRDDRCLA
jgi:hypothetical protein